MISGGFPESWRHFPQAGRAFGRERTLNLFTLSLPISDSFWGLMSLRERFRPTGAPAADPKAEVRASQSLAGRRGRAPIAPAPGAGKTVTAVLRPLLKQTGLGLNELKRRWVELAGESFARATPEKLAGGVLTLSVPGALAPFLQQQAPLLIDRLGVAGAKIRAVRIEQRRTPAKTGNVAPLKRSLSQAEEAALSQAFDPVGDPGLKSALMRLGRAVRQR
jgi:hypothetical protein